MDGSGRGYFNVFSQSLLDGLEIITTKSVIVTHRLTEILVRDLPNMK